MLDKETKELIDKTRNIKTEDVRQLVWKILKISKFYKANVNTIKYAKAAPR